MTPRLPAQAIAALLAGCSLGHALQAEPSTGWPESMLVSSRGRLFFTDRGELREINTRTLRVEPVARNITARELGFDTNNDLCAEGLFYDAKADVYRPRVWRLASDDSGRTVRIVREAGDEPAHSPVIDARGNLYFWQFDTQRGLSRVLVKRSDGTLHLLAGHHWGLADGKGAEARLGRIGAMAVSPDGIVYFTDHQSVRRIDADGTVTTVARGGLLARAGSAPEDNHLASITIDDDGTAYVADRAMRRVLAVNPEGDVRLLTASQDRWLPAGVAWNSGALFVLERHETRSRVVRVTRDGRRVELPGPERGRVYPQWLSRADPPNPHRLAPRAA